MFIRINIILAILSMLALTYSGNGQTAQESKVSNQTVDILVEQGLSILGKDPFGMSYRHGLRPLRFKVPTYETEVERFKITVDKFQTALLHEDKLYAYKSIYVRSFLAVAYCRLANAYEISSVGNLGNDLDRQIAYGACFAEYERVIKGTPTILTSRQTETYVSAIIESGNLELALNKIKEIRRFNKSRNLLPENLYYYEGDIYYKLGDKKKSGVAYDKWLRIKPDNVGVSDEIIIRLKSLNSETGLPTLKSIANLNN